MCKTPHFLHSRDLIGAANDILLSFPFQASSHLADLHLRRIPHHAKCQPCIIKVLEALHFLILSRYFHRLCPIVREGRSHDGIQHEGSTAQEESQGLPGTGQSETGEEAEG